MQTIPAGLVTHTTMNIVSQPMIVSIDSITQVACPAEIMIFLISSGFSFEQY